LLDLNAKRSSRRHLSFLTLRQQNASDARARASNASKYRALASTGNSAKNGSNSGAAANKDRRPLVAFGRNAALVIDSPACFRIIRRQASDKADASAVRKEKVIEIDPDRARPVHSLRGRHLDHSTFDD
jgi:hypothetical protein